jgi:hypothetical protein
MEEFDFWDDFNVLPEEFIDEASQSIVEDNEDKAKKGHKATATFREAFMARIENQTWKHDPDGLRLERKKRGSQTLTHRVTPSVRFSSRKMLIANEHVNLGPDPIIQFNPGQFMVGGQNPIDNLHCPTSDSEDSNQADLPGVFRPKSAITPNPTVDHKILYHDGKAPQKMKDIREVTGESLVQSGIRTPAKGEREGHRELDNGLMTSVGGGSWRSGGLGIKFGGGG